MAGSTQEVINHHLQAFGEGDAAAILEDCADDAVMIANDGTVLRGKQQLEQMVGEMLADFDDPGASFEMGQIVVEGDIAMITWTAETGSSVYELGSETYLIRDGKIVTHTITMKMSPK